MARDPLTVGVLIGDGAPMLEVAVAPRVFGVDPRFDVLVASEHPGPLSTTAGPLPPDRGRAAADLQSELPAPADVA